ncbi:MAG: VOC family protein [Kofleriaceae bacterium]
MVANVRAAATWCARVFGFVEHVQTPDGKHVQLGLPGGGELLVGEVRPRPSLARDGRFAAILVEVEDAAATLARAVDNYASVESGLHDGEAGERQAMIEDIFGHRWLLVQASRSEPRAHVVPVLSVANASAAVAWYARVFGFVELQTSARHPVRLSLGGGDLIIGETLPPPRLTRDDPSPEILLKVEDAAATLARAVDTGATVVFELRDIEAGERQTTVDDVFGHRWLLTQTLVDTAPEQWGGKAVTPRP